MSDFEQDEIRNKLLKIGLFIGYFRLISIRNKWNLKFKDLFRKSSFINRNNLTIDRDKLIKLIKNKSDRQDLEKQNILKQIQELEKKDYDAWQVCNGHDLINILSIGMQKVFGSLDAQQVKDTDKKIRLSYDFLYFIETQLYQDIIKWQTLKGYIVFKIIEN